jgi:hypothetical protein
MIHKLSKNISINDSLLIKNLHQTFTLTPSFDDKITMAKSLRKICYEKLEKLYHIIKDLIDLRQYNLFEFLAFRFTLINVQEKNYGYNYGGLDQSKRQWMIQTIKEARNFIDSLSVQ